MLTKLMNRLLLLTLLLLFNGCKDIYDQAKYNPPDWLAGKVFVQVSEQDNLTLFTECLRRVGMDTILDVSGSFTVFAPSDEAMNQYLSENGYQDVSDIPKEVVDPIVKYHIIQNAWSRNQLQKLDLDGWIDPRDPKSKPRAYKRQTLLKNSNEKYWVTTQNQEEVILADSANAKQYKKVYTRSRKYVPIFFDEFFEVFDLSPQDYSFYFNRDYQPGNIYYAGARITQDEIFAENGFVYVIDKVVKPMLNAKEMLERKNPGESYQTFLNLIYQFPDFRSNLQATFNQQDAREGKLFDTLFNLSFPMLPFDIHEELTGPNLNNSNYTYLYHNGVYVPTDEAFQSFLNDVVLSTSGLPHWNSFEDLPGRVKQIIVQSHFATTPVYPSDMSGGFEDANGSIIYIDESDIIRKEFGSNCTFLGLNKTIAPRALTSIAAPVYLRPGYSIFIYAIEYSKVLNALTKRNKEYCFFPIPDQVLELDSSLLINWVDREREIYRFRALNRADMLMTGMSASELGKRILNQVGTSLPTGSADKEFIETLGGKLIIWNNLDNTVQGSAANVFGYKGDSIIKVNPVLLEEPTDNGITYSVNSWFSHTSGDMYARISRYSKFRSLMQKAGMFDPKTFRFPFLTEGEFYTIFIPSTEAMENYGVDSLSIEDLTAFIRFHFVKGEKIFTDNKKAWKDYETLRVDESSTTFNTYYSTLNIRPGRDVIDILDEDGNPYVTIHETSGKNNIPIFYDTDKSPDSNSETDMIITAVAHEIDTVLIKQ